MGPKAPRSTVLTPEEEAIAVAFRKHTLLPLDDCLYALQATIPHLTRSALHRWLSRQAFKLDGGEAAVHALTVAFPNVAGVGLPVLVCAFGPKAALPVAIGIAAGAITISPLTLALLEIAKSGQAETAGAAVGPFDTFLAALGRSLRRPIFLGPALGVLVSALGVTPPPLLAASLGPVTACTAGVGLFLTGLMFSAQAIRLNGR